jgi:ketosteroid isomerase-like protein
MNSRLSASASSNRTTDEAAIRELVESWARAVRAKDLDGILCQSLYGHFDV